MLLELALYVYSAFKSTLTVPASQFHFSVTTISSTTYSTTTTITATMPFNICPFCPTNDTYIEPLEITLPIVKIRSGRYTDCQDLCIALYFSDCTYFNFYTSEYEGDLKNYCVLFMWANPGDKIVLQGHCITLKILFPLALGLTK